MSEAFEPDSALVSRVLPSSNFDMRARAIDMVLLHYTGMVDAESALARLASPYPPRVSCPYVILEDGTIVQMLPEAVRAWHAGAGSWEGREDVNSQAVGIEIVNPGHDLGYVNFPDAQIEATIRLVADICSRQGISPKRVLGHSDIAPGRKRDPGERFPWDRLAAAGLGLWAPPAPIETGPLYSPGEEGPPIQAVQALLAMLGFGLPITGVYDERTVAVVEAFQRHWRPALVDGVTDASTIKTLRAVLAAR